MTTYRLTVFFTFFVMLQFWNLFNARVFDTSDSAFKGISKSYGMELIILAIWRTDTDCTVWWSCIPHSAARFYDLDDDCRFYFVCFVDR